MSRSTTLLPYLAAMTSGVIVGIVIVLSRYALEQTSPGELGLLRYAIGFVCLLPAALLAPTKWFAWRDVPMIAVLGIGQFAILIILLNYSLHFITSALSALMFSTLPLQTMILAALMGRERLTWRKSAGVFLSIAGIAVSMGGGVLTPSDSSGIWIGAGLAAGSALVGALCSIFYRPYLDRYPTQSVSSFAMLASVGFLLIYTSLDTGLASLEYINLPGWMAITGIGICSGVGYFTWLWSLKFLTPTTVTLFLSLSPVTAALLGALFLSEALTFEVVLGIVMVAGGMTLALKPGTRTTVPSVETLQ